MTIPVDKLTELLEMLQKDRDYYKQEAEKARIREEKLTELLSRFVSNPSIHPPVQVAPSYLPHSTYLQAPPIPTEPSPLATMALSRYLLDISSTMDRRLFTFDSEGRSIYAGNFPPQEWISYKYVLNTTMFLMLPEEQRYSLVQEHNMEILLGVSPQYLRTYGLTDPSELRFIEEMTSDDIGYEAIVRALNMFRTDSFKVENLIVTPNSRYPSIIRERIDNIKTLQFLDTVKFFGGSITSYTYTFSLGAMLGNDWKDKFRSTVLTVFNQLLPNIRDNVQVTLSTDFNVLLQGDERESKVTRTITSDLLRDLKTFSIEEYFEDNPSDYLTHYDLLGELNPSSFTITTIKTKIRGGTINAGLIEERLKAKSTSLIPLSWGVARIVRSSGNYCFWAILADVFPTLHIPKEWMSCFSARIAGAAHAVVGPDGLMDFDNILKVCTFLRIEVMIYDIKGDILASNSPVYQWFLEHQGELAYLETQEVISYIKGSPFPEGINDSLDQLRLKLEGMEGQNRGRLSLLYHSVHYFKIVSVHHISPVHHVKRNPDLKVNTKKNALRAYKSLGQMFYRVVAVNSARDFGRDDSLPLMVSWKLGRHEWIPSPLLPVEGTTITSEPSLNIVSDMVAFLHNSILSDPSPTVYTAYHVDFIAFNGSQYDHHYLLKYLLLAGHKCYGSPLGQDNKVRKMTFRTSGTMIKGVTVHIYVHVWDPSLFIPATFDEALLSFSIIEPPSIPSVSSGTEWLLESSSKGDWKGLQDHYDSFSLRSYLNQERKELMVLDSKTHLGHLESLCQKLEDKFSSMGINIFEYPSITSLSYRLWKIHVVEDSLSKNPLYRNIQFGRYAREDPDGTLRFEVPSGTLWGGRLLREEDLGDLKMEDILMVPSRWNDLDSSQFNRKFYQATGINHWNSDKEAIIRSGIEGGRVQSMVGTYGVAGPGMPSGLIETGRLYLADKVSLYPNTMWRRSYPVGKSVLIQDPAEFVRKVQEDPNVRHYVTRCTFNQDSLPRNLKSILKKTEGGEPVRDWNSRGEWEGMLINEEVELLEQLGVDVSVTGPSIVWYDSQPIFHSFVSEYKGMKEDEDAKRARGEPYDGVMRNMMKLLLNSLYGKTLQNPIRMVTHLFQGLSEFEAIVEGGGELSTPVMITDQIGYIMSPPKIQSTKVPSWLGLWTLSLSNLEMYRQCYSVTKVPSRSSKRLLRTKVPVEIYAGDTDSVIVKAEDASLVGIVSPGPMKNFGDLELKDESDLLMVAGSKMLWFSPSYWRLKGIKKTDLIFRTKGIESTILERDPRKVFEWLMEDGEIIARSYHTTKRVRDLRIFTKVRTIHVKKGKGIDRVESILEDGEGEVYE